MDSALASDVNAAMLPGAHEVLVDGKRKAGTSDAVPAFSEIPSGKPEGPVVLPSYLKSDRSVCGAWLAIDRACTPSCCWTWRA